MKKEKFRIVFMGTPEFAVHSLRTLVENGFCVVGVVTMPDKRSGRGHQFRPSPVKEYAEKEGLRILQPQNLKDNSFLSELASLKADLQIVVAFRMLPEAVWNMPPKGTFNLHASLLPQYRGAAPINWAIINGETETGATTFFLSHDIDTGHIIFQRKIHISPSDNAGTIHDRLMQIGADLVIKTTNAIISENVAAKPQDEFISENGTLKPAPKIFKETCRIDWNKTEKEVFNLIRGLSPYPGAWTCSSANPEATFKIFASETVGKPHSVAHGTIITDNKTFIEVAVKNGRIRILEIQAPGKKRMSTRDFLNGFDFANEALFI